MTVEADIFATLQGLVGGRVRPDFAPLGTARPFIIYEQAGGDALYFLDGTLPDKKHGRFEISIYADERPECAALALQVEAAMAAATAFQSTALHAPMSDYASEVKIYSSTQNFSVYSTR